MNILVFIGLVIFGILIILYTVPFVKVVGRMDWAERWFGPTGTYTAWKIIGVGAIVAGIWLLRYM